MEGAAVAHRVARAFAFAFKAINIVVAGTFLVLNVWFATWAWPLIDKQNRWPVPSPHDYLHLAIPAIGLVAAGAFARIRRPGVALPLAILTLPALLVAAYFSVFPTVAFVLLYALATA